MDKKFRKKFFLICLVGGILFAIPFFFGFGAEIGYPWYWALICLGLGFVWAVMFYFIWIIVEKFQKPFSPENKRAQQKLLAYENARSEAYEHKFSAFMNYGKGLRQEICETCIYFEHDKIHIAFCHVGKVYSFDIPYKAVDKALVFGNVLTINSSAIGDTAYAIKQISSKLIELLNEKGLYHEISSYTTGKLFTTGAERTGTAYYEFQYCKQEGSLKTLEKGNGYWEKDSLLVHIDSDRDFFEIYGDYLNTPNSTEATQALDPYGVNYYTKEQTFVIIEQIKNDKPQEFDVLVTWLEKAATEYNGFFFLGI